MGLKRRSIHQRGPDNDQPAARETGLPAVHRNGSRRRLPRLIRGRYSARLRLTAVYGGLCLLAGLVLLGVLFLLSSQTMAGRAEVVIRDGVTGQSATRESNIITVPKGSFTQLSGPQIKSLAGELRDDALRQLFTGSALALLIMTVFATAVGWWVAGRVLRPLHTITSRARTLSWRNIHERIAMTGPRDELRELADTFDGMLGRLDQAFSSQRRFIANASHELRTPLALERATIQVRLSDPDPADLPAIRDELLIINRRFERLIEGLLTLARSEHHLSRTEPVDLAALVTAAVADLRAAPPAGSPPGVTIQIDTTPTPALGDEILLGQLVANLLRNAVRHNIPGGWVEIHVSPVDGLLIRNSGPTLNPATIEDLFEPFRRGDTHTGPTDGAGLGLSIVRAITHTHGGTITATPEPTGGLRITVLLPTPDREFAPHP